MERKINVKKKSFQIGDIFERFEIGKLNLKPNYKSDFVWPLKAKNYLIDSIFNGYPIPALSVSQRFNSKTKKNYIEIIDGEQRLAAIISFINNEFCLPSFINDSLANKYYKDLSDDEQNYFLSFELDFLIFLPDEQFQIYEIYSRLNTFNKSLNKQELIQSKYFGYFRMQIDKLYLKYLYSFNYGEYKFYKENDIKRLLPKTDFSRMFIFLLYLDNNEFHSDSITDVKTIFKKYDDVNIKEINKYNLLFERIIFFYDYLLELKESISMFNRDSFKGKVFDKKFIITLMQFLIYLNKNKDIKMSKEKLILQKFIIYLDNILSYFSIKSKNIKNNYEKIIKNKNKNWKNSLYKINFYDCLNNSSTYKKTIEKKIKFLFSQYLEFKTKWEI